MKIKNYGLDMYNTENYWSIHERNVKINKENKK